MIPGRDFNFEEDVVWFAACALAEHRHPNNKYPQPNDKEDAEIVLTAIDKMIVKENLKKMFSVQARRWRKVND